MRKRLASLVLLLVIAGGALAGVPLHSGESECSMGGMMAMDRCKAALLQKEMPEVANAKLCRALNCPQNRTTSFPGHVRNSPPSQLALRARPPAAALPP